MSKIEDISNMKNSDFVSYPIAVKLKACGFDEPCDHYYCAFDNETDVRFWSMHPAQSQNGFTNPDGKVIADAPTLAHAQKWLREKLLLNIGVNPAIPTLKWQFYIDDLNQHVNPHDGELMTRWDDDMQEKADKRMYDSYECALSAGIAAALELIKKGE